MVEARLGCEAAVLAVERERERRLARADLQFLYELWESVVDAGRRCPFDIMNYSAFGHRLEFHRLRHTSSALFKRRPFADDGSNNMMQ